ncbi:Rubredoxin [Olavius algarvensis Delta 1 endosymbiont]|nr:Rubredoxin [Olavius algarvensis Delta 1 endosymbiont]
MQQDWLKTLGKMTYGIYVLTSSHQDEFNGMIASWVSQISFDPLLVMVAVHPNRYSHQLIEKSGRFALHVIDRRQSEFLARFKGPDPKSKFLSVQWKRGKTGCPILNDCMAYLDCQVKAGYAPGNHTLFVGEVVDARSFADGTPFSSLDYSGVYLGKD